MAIKNITSIIKGQKANRKFCKICNSFISKELFKLEETKTKKKKREREKWSKDRRRQMHNKKKL